MRIRLASPRRLSRRTCCQVRSNSNQRKPWRALAGWAWWLLCHPHRRRAVPPTSSCGTGRGNRNFGSRRRGWRSSQAKSRDTRLRGAEEWPTAPGQGHRRAPGRLHRTNRALGPGGSVAAGTSGRATGKGVALKVAGVAVEFLQRRDVVQHPLAVGPPQATASVVVIRGLI